MERLVVPSGNGNARNGGIAIGVGSVADGTSGTGNGNGHSGGVAINGGHTHQGWYRCNRQNVF